MTFLCLSKTDLEEYATGHKLQENINSLGTVFSESFVSEFKGFSILLEHIPSVLSRLPLAYVCSTLRLLITISSNKFLSLITQ